MHGNFQPCQGPTKQFITHGSLKPHGWLIIEADLLTKSKINISHDNNPLFYLPHEQQWMLIVNSQQLAKHPKIVLHKVLNSTLAKQYWHCKMPHLSPSLLELHVIALEHTMSEAIPTQKMKVGHQAYHWTICTWMQYGLPQLAIYCTLPQMPGRAGEQAPYHLLSFSQCKTWTSNLEKLKKWMHKQGIGLQLQKALLLSWEHILDGWLSQYVSIPRTSIKI